MKDWNLRYLVSIEVKKKDVVERGSTWNYFKGSKKLKEGFYKVVFENRFWRRGYDYYPMEETHTGICPEGYVFEDGVLYHDNNRVVLTFVDGSVCGIRASSFDDAVALKEKIIKDCGEGFNRLNHPRAN